MHFSVSKKLPKVLSRLNEINGGCEKNLHLPVYWDHFEVI